MSLSFTVGGARGTFEEGFAAEVAGVLDKAFGSENDWEGIAPRHFGEPGESGWRALRDRARAELGEEGAANLLALADDGRGVYLPAHVRAVSLPLSAGAPLRCASLTGLRAELAELSTRWGLPLDDDGLGEILRAESEGGVALAVEPETLAFARLALAANEATRRDCPLWIVG